jgi:hypothetical protein
MSSFELTDSLLLAQGGERFCFIHPKDNSKIIKVIKPELINHNEQNKLEDIYYNFLYAKYEKEELSYIAKYYSKTDTNYGDGLIFERIIDYNGENSKHFRYYLKNNILSNEEELCLLDDLKSFLEYYNILFIDVSTVNLFCQEISKNRYKLIVFDGLGGRRFGFKFSLYLKSKLFTKYKVKKQWKKFILNYEKDKKIANR